MDFSKFKTPDWLIIGGGLVFLIFGFFKWFDTGPIDSGAFQFTFTGLIPWLLLVASAIVTFLLVGGMLKAGNVPWTLIILAATVLAALLVLLRLLIGADASDFVALPSGASDPSVSRQFPLFVAVLAAIVSAAGAFMKFQAGGGSLSDFADRDKMRGAFKGGNDSPPPPRA